MEEISAMLKHLGFTEYEAKAYIALLINGKLTAERLSVVAKVPLPRVYDVMGNLETRGLVYVSKTRPQVFRSVDPKSMLALLERDEKKKIEEQVSVIKEMVPQFLKKLGEIPKHEEEEEEEALAVIKRRVNMDAWWADFHKKAKTELLIFAGDMSWLVKTLPVIKAAVKRGVKYRVIWCKSDPESITNLKALMKMPQIELRHNPHIKDLRGLIVDRREVSLNTSAPKLGAEVKDNVRPSFKHTEDTHQFSMLLINQKIVVEIFLDYFDILWENGVPARQFLKKVK
jgi:sugar-specific transcriptional regulator TrmB